ncbi:helix-turn-helix domain-containing protein [Zobellella sp. An-6]|uniref:helix-turn-helix domain-containing protein n=1 Tax=Zobellella sp. An-6 TaxID=3400218 RepID=UPI00404110A1
MTHIEKQQDHEQTLALMDEMVDDYDANKALIDILSLSIEHWEEHADEFADFTAALAEMDNGISVLKNLMAQHHLGVADLPELGSKGNVSKLLNGVDGKKLTCNHIEALSRRFGVSPALFFERNED